MGLIPQLGPCVSPSPLCCSCTAQPPPSSAVSTPLPTPSPYAAIVTRVQPPLPPSAWMCSAGPPPPLPLLRPTTLKHNCHRHATTFPPCSFFFQNQALRFVHLDLVDDMTPVISLNSAHTSWLWLTIWLRSDLLTPIAHHGSGRWACYMSYHFSCERHCMVGLDDYNILHSGHLVGSRLGGTHDSFSI
jgi:hypothetical protein